MTSSVSSFKESAQKEFPSQPPAMTTAGLRKVEAWLRKRSFRLRLVGARRCSEMLPELREVRLRRGAPAAMLSVALHECGHVLVYLQRRKTRKALVAGRAWRERDSDLRPRPTRAARLRCLQEEFEAWDRGRRLAARLRIRVCAASFGGTMDRALTSYVVALPLPPAPRRSKPTTSVKCTGSRKSS